jgi:thiosulfate reductase cytochrome b subunit
MASSDAAAASVPDSGHALRVRITHAFIAGAVLTLAFSGFMILLVHPRLYWGKVGNDLMPALIELPLNRNHQPEHYATETVWQDGARSYISATRDYPIFNQNGWARSLHFLAAWILVPAALVYQLLGLGSGHLRRDILPGLRELAPANLWRDVRAHLAAPAATHVGPPYNLLQKLSYSFVAVIALPLMVLTGITMSPAITAAAPWLLDLFGGSQSARTIHFFTFALLLLFVIAHLAMVALAGLRRQVRGITIGGRP